MDCNKCKSKEYCEYAFKCEPAISNIVDECYSKESVTDDLKKFADEWDESLYRSDAVIAGAQWQKERILNEAWNEGLLQNWYIDSIDETKPPVWTKKHIEELCKDFYLIKKENV